MKQAITKEKDIMLELGTVWSCESARLSALGHGGLFSNKLFSTMLLLFAFLIFF